MVPRYYSTIGMWSRRCYEGHVSIARKTDAVLLYECYVGRGDKVYTYDRVGPKLWGLGLEHMVVTNTLSGVSPKVNKSRWS